MCLQVSVDMEQSIQMTFTRTRDKGREHRNFSSDINITFDSLVCFTQQWTIAISFDSFICFTQQWTICWTSCHCFIRT